MAGVPDPVYRAHVAPRLLAPAAELILDAAAPLAEGERVLEVEAGAGLVSRVLGRRAADAGAELWVVDEQAARVSALRRLPGVRLALVGNPRELPFPDAAVDRLVLNGFNAARHPFAGLLKEARRVLKPGGELLLTCFIAGTFEELLDLLLEALEARGEGELCRSLSDARASLADERLIRDVLAKTGFALEAYGEEERAVFPRGQLIEDPLFTICAPGLWLGQVPPLPWEAVANAARAYFADAAFTVRVNTAILRARAV